MKSYFMLGTDTDCGKTYVTCALIRALKAQQKSVVALKPVASGCDLIGDRLVSQDVQCLQKAQEDEVQEICPWAFSLPVSPHLAAQAAGTQLQSHDIVSFLKRKVWQHYEYMLIEGAGGLMVPLNDQETWIDVLKQSQIPALLVVGMRLGCINHALLTAAALAYNGIPCIGWVANCLDPHMLCLEENIETIKNKLTFPLLARVNRDGEWEPACELSMLFKR